MFKSQHYRAKATEYGELVKTWTSPEKSREFQKLERRFASLADNEQVLADDHKSAAHVSNHDQSRGAALAIEEEYVLRCLGAALIMQWNTLPTTLQREVFDTAGSVGKLLETAALRGQIARFLHKHKNDCGCDKLTPTEDTFSDATLRLCRGGTMREAQSATHCRCEYADNRRTPNVTYTIWRR
jgi:hypothetical protein